MFIIYLEIHTIHIHIPVIISSTKSKNVLLEIFLENIRVRLLYNILIILI